jgi:DNA-binding IclR family transcriptional regulator
VQLIESQPGISASDVAKTMKIKPNYLYRVLGDLEKEGRVKKDGRQYYPTGG